MSRTNYFLDNDLIKIGAISHEVLLVNELYYETVLVKISNSRSETKTETDRFQSHSQKQLNK